MRIHRTICGVMLGMIGLTSVTSLRAEEISKLMISAEEVEGVCEPIDGAFPVSQQAGVEYGTAGSGAVRGVPSSKDMQSFKCGDSHATVYWYEYPADADIESITQDFRTVLWGGAAATEEHPELILVFENVVAIVSSRQPIYLAWLLAHRREFPDVDEAILEGYIAQLQCSLAEPRSKGACQALAAFKTGLPPTRLLSEERLLLGQSWEISQAGEAGAGGYEMLYISAIDVAAFRAVRPENAEEEKQINEQMLAQLQKRQGEGTEPLLEYVRNTLGGTQAGTILLGKSLAFLGQGMRVYVREVGDALVLVTDAGAGEEKQPFLVATFPLGK